MGRYRAAETDVLAVDETIHHYHRAAQQQRTFCWPGGAGTNIELIDSIIQRKSALAEATDWWQRGQLRPRR